MDVEVTCLCPTHGRLDKLLNALACYLTQTYPARRLLICNDAPMPIVLCAEGVYLDGIIVEYGHGVRVHNAAYQAPTLGDKRQFLLDSAETALVTHWDDDDIYLPWHVDMLVREWSQGESACVKPRAGWYVLGHDPKLTIRSTPHHNTFEGQMLFERDTARKLGGYPSTHSGQARALMGAFRKAGQLHTWNPDDARVSYCYRWADGAHHISAIGNKANAATQFAERNTHYGDGRPIISGDWMEWARDRLAPIWHALMAEWMRIYGDGKREVADALCAQIEHVMMEGSDA
jgi:hypothetical protein